MPLSTIIFFVVCGLVMVGGLVYTSVSKAKTKAAFQAAVKAHPELYYVSQGGTIPDPIVVDTPVDPTA
jgi:hypothetical protein